MPVPLIAQQLYRLLAKVPLAYVRGIRAAYGAGGQKALLANVAERLTTLGFKDTKLVTQDPTDNTLMSAITRYEPSPEQVKQHSTVGFSRDPYLQILKTEAVEEPPAPMKGESHQDPRHLDPGLSSDEAATIRYALTTERNPRHLTGIAETLEPWFPVSASLLRMKAMLIEARVPMVEARSMNLVKEAHNTRNTHPQLPIIKQRFDEYARKAPVPDEVLRDEVKRAACAIADHREQDLGNVPSEIKNLARVIVRDVPFQDEKNKVGMLDRGLKFICPRSLRQAFPPDGKEGFVSPPALQLALAMCKPEWSGVAGRSERILSVYDKFGDRYLRTRMSPSQRTDLLKARNQMERAKRAIERRRWIEWYRRTQVSHGAP